MCLLLPALTVAVPAFSSLLKASAAAAVHSLYTDCTWHVEGQVYARALLRPVAHIDGDTI
jgi:hypothetical protein